MPGKVRLLFFGDIIGRPGRNVLRSYLSRLKEKYSPTIIVANGENAAGGIGITSRVAAELFELVDILTSGNHVWDKKEIIPYLDQEHRLLRPANYPLPNPGLGATVVKDEEENKVAFLNLQGRVFMEPIDCPFKAADQEVSRLREQTPVVVVDFHAEASSEKQALAWYLNGRVSAVLGTHTHVPTADARILPGGTAFITDIGMVGGYNSVIGLKKDQALERFLTGRPQRFEPEKKSLIINAVFLEIDASTGKALDIRQEIIMEENGQTD